MGVLQRFERRLGGLVEGAFARVFKGAVEPVEVITALQREAGDRRRVLGEGRVVVPNRYVVELGTSDYETLNSYGTQLRDEMVTGLHKSLDDNGWTVFGSLTVDLVEVSDLDTGVFRVHGEVVEAPQPARAAAARSAPATSGPSGGATPGDGDTRMLPVMPQSPPAPTEPPPARLVDDQGRQFPLVDGTVVIGRGAEVDCSLPDTGISRRHAELRTHGRHVVIRDLGSTNGTQVNGRQVQERELRDGDAIRVGSTVLTLRTDS